MRSLPQVRYVEALRRQRGRIASGLELNLVDSNAQGDRHSSANWGLCSDEKAAWPDPEDHSWPDQFVEDGRVAPRHRTEGQDCPFDDPKRRRPNDTGTWGCFYRCMLFQSKSTERPDGKRALELYDDMLRKLK